MVNQKNQQKPTWRFQKLEHLSNSRPDIVIDNK